MTTRHLLSEFTSISLYSTFGVFADGDAITVNVYKDGSSTPETTSSALATQIGTTGVFAYSLSLLDNAPTDFSEYYFTMEDATTKQDSGSPVYFGGWPESVEPLGATDTCKLTINLYDGDGVATINPNDLFSTTSDNHVEIKTKYFQTDRYFKFGKYKPSYDALTSQAFWILPQGATVDIKLDLFGVTSTGTTIPAQSTIDIYTLLNP